MNLNAARQSQIGAKRPERRRPSPIGKDEEEGRFGKVAASSNSQNLTERGRNLIVCAMRRDTSKGFLYTKKMGGTEMISHNLKKPSIEGL